MCVCASVSILGLVIFGVERCCSVSIAIIYAISIAADVLFLILGFMARAKAQSSASGPAYSSSVRVVRAYVRYSIVFYILRCAFYGTCASALALTQSQH